jgi:putative addiction module component (TIGR02574 family)
MAISVTDTLSLPVKERLRLVAEIWESIAEVPDAIELTPETRQMLTERLALYRKNPAAGVPWTELKQRLRER